MHKSYEHNMKPKLFRREYLLLFHLYAIQIQPKLMHSVTDRVCLCLEKHIRDLLFLDISVGGMCFQSSKNSLTSKLTIYVLFPMHACIFLKTV